MSITIEPGHALELYEDAVARHDGRNADTDLEQLGQELLNIAEALEAEARERRTVGAAGMVPGPMIKRLDRARDAWRRGTRLLLQVVLDRELTRALVERTIRAELDIPTGANVAVVHSEPELGARVPIHELELASEEVLSLRVLAGDGALLTTLRQLVARVLDGVGRPGSWERGWLCQAFGDGWVDRMRQDPECTWRQLPVRFGERDELDELNDDDVTARELGARDEELDS